MQYFQKLIGKDGGVSELLSYRECDERAREGGLHV